MIDDYKDIINLPHYEPKHPRMSRYKRAAQFAPFAALTGYEEQVKETARLTNKKIEIDEGLRSNLNDKLNQINSNINLKSEVTITYFVEDQKKSGGSYITITGNVKKINTLEESITMTNKTKIYMNDIVSITSNIL